MFNLLIRLPSLVMAFLLMSCTIVRASDSVESTYKGFNTVHILLNQKQISSEVPAINVDGTSLVPLRVIAETLNAQIAWYPETSTVNISTENSPTAVGNDDDKNEGPFSQKVTSIYDDVDFQIKILQNLIQQLQIAKDIYIFEKDDDEIENIQNISFKKLKADLDDLSNRKYDLLEEYPQKEDTLETTIAIVDQLEQSTKDYETALNYLLEYTDSDGDKENKLSRFYSYFSKTNQDLYTLQTMIHDNLTQLQQQEE